MDRRSSTRTALSGVSAAEGARRLALQYLAQARAAYARLDDPEDGEALHDFRVALRRLRTCIDAYWSWLSDTVRPRDRRRLTQLARATNPTRDLEIQIAWLTPRLEQLGPVERPGAEALIEELRAEHERGVAALREERLTRFPRIADRLESRLRRYQIELDPDHPPATFGAALASGMGLLATRLAGHLDAATSLAAGRELHQGRIAAKQLRYLLEPLRQVLRDAARAHEQLTILQDLLGELQDALVFTERVLPRLNTPEQIAVRRAIASILWEHRCRLFDRLEAEWRQGRAASFFALLDRLKGEVASQGRPPQEIERKFLLSRLPPLPRGAAVAEIDQGWLPGTVLRERVRRVLDSQGERWYRTVKLGAGMSRMEIEEPTTSEVFEALWPLTEGCRIRKLRYRVQDGALAWEIDRFVDRDLVLAEIELPTEDTPVILPEWLAPHVVREVTGEPAYLNLNLAR